MINSMPFMPILSIKEINERADNFYPLAVGKKPDLTKDVCRSIAQYANSLRVPIPFGVLNIDLFGKKGSKSGQSPSPSANMIHALVLRSGLIDDMTVTWDDSDEDEGLTCIVWARRKGNGMEFEFSFSERDAERANLLGNDTYQKYLRQMLLWRATKPVDQYLFDDVIAGMYSPDEMGADGEVFDVIDTDGKVGGGGGGEIIEAEVISNQPKDDDEVSSFREVFDDAWQAAHDDGVNVAQSLEDYNEETNRDPESKLMDGDLIELTRRLHHAIKSPF